MALNILIVDDSQTVRGMIAKTLALAGVPINEIHQAANGRDALQILRSHSIDLVLSDINMPVVDGLEMIDQMKQDAALKAIPIIVASTEGSTTRMEQLKAQGIHAYIRKPFTPEQLRAAVDNVIGGRDGRQA
jgi:two-component system chemotaxis response regulator CheY